MGVGFQTSTRAEADQELPFPASFRFSPGSEANVITWICTHYVMGCYSHTHTKIIKGNGNFVILSHHTETTAGGHAIVVENNKTEAKKNKNIEKMKAARRLNQPPEVIKETISDTTPSSERTLFRPMYKKRTRVKRIRKK